MKETDSLFIDLMRGQSAVISGWLVTREKSD
jgi:hypothetical protein